MKQLQKENKLLKELVERLENAKSFLDYEPELIKSNKAKYESELKAIIKLKEQLKGETK